MGIISDYFELQREYEKKYGEKTVVIYQVGSFYEIYEYDPSEDQRPNPRETKIGHAVQLSTLLNIILTKKNKSIPHSIENPYMIGFPIVSYEKNRDAILSHDYTIVRIDQNKIKNGTKEYIDRNVKEVISPGTNVDTSIQVGTSSVVCIYAECQKCVSNHYDKWLIISGLSAIDVTTGKNIVCEVYSKEEDPVYVFHEIYRFLVSQLPREILFYLNKVPAGMEESTKKWISEQLDLSRFSTVLFRTNDINKEYMKISYQRQLLSKIFKRHGSEGSIFEDLNLERYMYGCISYICLLQHCYEHNETIISKIQLPDTTWIDTDRHLILTHNAIVQLDLISTERKETPIDSLFSVVNNTSTALGKRLLRSMLLNPLTDPDKLDSYYSMTDELITHRDLLNDLEIRLKKFPDIERLHRQLNLEIIKPAEFCLLIRSYINFIDVCQLINSHAVPTLQSLLLQPDQVSSFNSCLTYILSSVKLETLEKYLLKDGHLFLPDGSTFAINEDISFLLPGIDSTVDKYLSSFLEADANIHRICDYLNTFISGSGKKIEYSYQRRKSSDEKDDDDGPCDITVLLTTTSHKASILRKNIDRIDVHICGNLDFKSIRSTSVMITSDKINKYCAEIEQYRDLLEKQLVIFYLTMIRTINTKYQFFSYLNRLIGYLDFIKSNAMTAIKYKYFRPTIDRSASSSFIIAKQLRHPIIERLIMSQYIPNDISIGRPNESSLSPYGYLVYGLNSCGKSSLTKSVGLNLILAQAGLFTAGQFTYYPYSKIVTRLSGHDDIFKGKSSFVVEMSELRTILRNSDNRTLVLGDELCRGTETTSGISLTIATLLTLLDRKSSFIFSTHMHDIPKSSYISSLDRSLISVCHLSASFDEKLDLLIYDRQLKSGSGSSIYGLEVAKSLNLDQKFLSLANKIRRSIGDISCQLLSSKKSNYSSKLYVDSCFLCGVSSQLETHHLREQHEADENGFIDYFHKNSPFNLVILCKKCHHNLHSNNSSLHQKQTISGTIITQSIV